MTNKLKTVFLAALFSVAAINAAHAADEVLWQQVCDNEKDNKTCRMVQQLSVHKKGEDGKDVNLGPVLTAHIFYANVTNAESKKQERLPVMVMQMPLGVDLRAGAVMKVDDGAEKQLDFAQCTRAGCETVVPLADALLKEMRAGKNLVVGFRPLGVNKVSALQVSLNGFSSAFKKLK